MNYMTDSDAVRWLDLPEEEWDMMDVATWILVENVSGKMNPERLCDLLQELCNRAHREGVVYGQESGYEIGLQDGRNGV